MNAARFLEHFDRICEAPDAVPRLRRFILDLAVRGKLVEQDPGDEPVTQLLKQVQAERDQLMRQRLLKRVKAEPQSTEDGIPFDLPTTWRWVPLQHLIVFGPQNGISPRPSARADAPKAITLTATTKGVFDPRHFKHVEVSISQHSEYWLRPGDLLFQRGNTREYVGMAAYYNGEPYLFVYPDLMMKVRVSDRVSLSYIHLCAVAPHARAYFSTHASGAQATMPKINQATLVRLPVPLPPLAEQRRIVAKVDELMTLCDRLETAQAKREGRRARLTAASLHRLGQPAPSDQKAEATAFREHARFHLRHLPRLTSRSEQIQQLRQTILELAVRGRLVPQDPDDEPAYELLKRIESEKARLVREGNFRRAKPLNPPTEDEVPFATPRSWRWVRIGTCSLLIDYGTSVKSDVMVDGAPILKMGDVQGGRVLLGGQKKVPHGIQDLPRLYLNRFDLLYNRTNSAELVGKTGIFLGEDELYTFASYLIRIRFVNSLLDAVYLNLAMNAPFFRATQIVPELQQQCGQANVNGTKLRSMVVPLPPLAEQHRIVAKVDDLMSLCDQLEARLTTGQTEKSRLLEAVLHEALEPAVARAVA